MRNATTLLFILFVTIGFAQHTERGSCYLKQESKTWLAEYKKMELGPEKIDLVINKIIADNEYFINNPQSPNLITCTKKCSIRFGLMYGKKDGLTFDLQKSPLLEDLMVEFTEENIYRMELNEHHAKDVYKSVGIKRSGIVMYTDDKELKKKIKRTLKDIEKS